MTAAATLGKMPSIEENRRVWGADQHWSDDGNEWSWTWGGPETQWHATWLPRLRRFLPAETVLEIATGRGRWTQFAVPLSSRFIGVDLVDSCVEVCRCRFASSSNAEFHLTDGRSLDCVNDGIVDLAFSFDSLVHAEDDVIAAYLEALAAKLSADGVAVLHHSNIARYRRVLAVEARAESHGLLPPQLRGALKRVDLADWRGWRALSMSAERFAELAGAVGLSCIGQEKVNWGGRRLIDCISVATRRGSRWDRPNVVVANPHFMDEAFSAGALARIYTSLPPRRAQLAERLPGPNGRAPDPS